MHPTEDAAEQPKHKRTGKTFPISDTSYLVMDMVYQGEEVK
jgi:hypothetical protein